MWDTLVSFDSNACFPIRQTCFTIFIKKPNDAASSALQIIISHTHPYFIGRWFFQMHLTQFGFLLVFEDDVINLLLESKRTALFLLESLGPDQVNVESPA